MRKRRRKQRSLARPALGRNLAVRPGAGAHTPEEEKRAADKLRREIDDQEREQGERNSLAAEESPPK